MKRIFAWLLAAAILLSLAGCKGSADVQNSDSLAASSSEKVSEAVSSAVQTMETSSVLSEPTPEEPEEPEEPQVVASETDWDGEYPGEPESTLHLFEGYTPLPQSPAELSGETIAEIKAACSAQWQRPVDSIVIRKYINTYDGAVAFTAYSNEVTEVPAIAWLGRLGAYSICCDYVNDPMVYKNGELKDAFEAYDAGWLSDEAAKDLAWYYKY